MKRTCLLLLFVLTAAAQAADPATTLWFDQPALSFHESLPLGNGRLGAMVFGGVHEERIVLNENSVWSGSHDPEADRPGAQQVLPEIRRLLLAGKNVEAEQLVNGNFTCQGQGSGYGSGANVPFGCYQTLGNLWLRFGNAGGASLGGWSWRGAASVDDARQIAASASADGWQPAELNESLAQIPVGQWKMFRTSFQVPENQLQGWTIEFGALDDTSVVFLKRARSADHRRTIGSSRTVLNVAQTSSRALISSHLPCRTSVGRAHGERCAGGARDNRPLPARIGSDHGSWPGSSTRSMA